MAEPFQLKLTLNLKDFRNGITALKATLSGIAGDARGAFSGVAGGLAVLANGVHVVRGAIDGLRASFAVLNQFSEQGQALEEGASKFEAVFKEVTASADAFAKKLSNDVGRSVVQVKNALADTQGVLSGFGFDRSKAAEISQTVIQLGIDLASFNNATDDEAFGALRAGLLGEAEALKKFGVALTEAAVQQQAFQLGFDPNNLNEQEKVLTRLAIITKQTADAQGDAVRTSDSFANQSKRLSGVLFDLAANIGKGINEALKPALAGITQFIAANEERITGAVDGLTTAIQTGLESALTLLGGSAERAGQTIINIFTELPATIDAFGDSLNKMKDFAVGLFAILTGGASKTNDQFSQATSIFELFEQALTSPGVIVAMAKIRIAVAAVSGGLSALFQVGQLVVAGIEALFAGVVQVGTQQIRFLLNALGTVSADAKAAAEGIEGFIDGLMEDAENRAVAANETIGQIADLTTGEIDSANFDIQNAGELSKAMREQAKLRREAAKAERETADAAKKTKEAEEAKATAAAKTAGSFKEQKEAQELVKKATEETKRAEDQLADARAKATETIKDDLALIRERIAGEIKAAKTAEEAAQIRKRGILQETALIEDAQRKQAEATKRRIEEDKKAASSLREFLTGQERGRRRDKGLGLGADAEESIERVADQKGNIRTAEDRDALVAEITATQQANLDKRTEALRKMSESIGDIRRELDDSRANGDFDAAAQKQEELRQAQSEYAKKLEEVSDAGKRDSATAAKAIEGVNQSFEAIQKVQAEAAAKAAELAQTTPGGDGAAVGSETSTTAQTPVDGAVETLKGVIEGANTALRSGLESLAGGIANLATAAQELLNTSNTIFPQVIASLDGVLASQQQSNANVLALGTAMRDKLAELAAGNTEHAGKIAALTAEVKQIKATATGVLDARTGGL